MFILQPSATICYCNSATQVLFHCLPFRQAVLNYEHVKGGDEGAEGPNMLVYMRKLFKDMVKAGQGKVGAKYDHKEFIKAVKKGNVLFDNDEHHDSHEYLNWMLD